MHETSSGRRYVPPLPLILSLSLRGHISRPTEQPWGSEIWDSVTHESSMSESTKCLHKISVLCVIHNGPRGKQKAASYQNQTQFPKPLSCNFYKGRKPGIIFMSWIENGGLD